MGVLTIGKKLSIGFGLLLAALLIISILSTFRLIDASDGFSQYRHLARDANLVGRIQANLLIGRTAVKNYLMYKQDADLAEFQSRWQTLAELVEQAKLNSGQQNLAILAAISSSSQLYAQDVLKIQNLVKEELSAMNTLNSLGPALQAELMRIETTNDMLARDSATIGRHLNSGRLALLKYIYSVDKEQFDFLEAELNTAINHASQLEAFDLQTQSLKRYLAGARVVRDAIDKRQQIVISSLDVIGPNTSEQIEALKLNIMKAQDTVGPVLQQNNQNAVYIILFSSIIGAIVAIAASVGLTRHITTRLSTTANAAKVMASGHLDIALDIKGEDEIASLMQDLNAMAISLRTIIQEILGASGEMSQSAQRLASLTEQTKTGTLQQQSETDQVATAINQMAAAAHQVSMSASGVADASERATLKVKEGLSLVDESRQKIHILSTNAREAAIQIHALEDETVNIGSILDVIKGIAEQTNLLALNAAIEAARAGDQGRGFAVVSDEVRALAQRTQESTDQIQNMINKLQRGASSAVSAIEADSEITKECVVLSDKANIALQEIDLAVCEVNDMTAQIASAAEEQNQVAEQINMNIMNVKVITEQSAASADETAASSYQLNSVSHSLQSLVSKFSISKQTSIQL